MPLPKKTLQRLAIQSKIAKKRGQQTLFTFSRPPLPTAILSDFRPSAPTLTQRLRSEPVSTAFADDDFQAIGSSWMITNDHGILADDMGLGKTKMTLDAIMHVHLPGLHLIVCAASNIDTWMDEWAKFYPHVPTFAYRGKDRVQNALEWISAFRTELSCLVVSYDTFRNDWELLCKPYYMWCVLDEGHTIRGNPLNSMSQIAQKVHDIKAVRKHILTGTPIMKTPADAWNLMRWLGREELEFDDFLAKCCIVSEVKMSRWSTLRQITNYTPYGNVHIRNMLQSSMIRRIKGDILHLPKKTYHEIDVRMNASDTYAYKQLDKMYATASKSLRTGENTPIPPNVIQQQMLELTASSKYKIDKVDQLVKEAIDAERKVMVVATRISTLRELYDRLDKYGLVWITGKVATDAKPGERSERQKRVDSFQNDPKKRVLLATQQSTRVGLTLTAASVFVRVAREWNPSQNEQAIARIDRAGQQSEMDIYDLYSVLPNGVDTVERTHVKRALDKKIKRSDMIIQGTVRDNESD